MQNFYTGAVYNLSQWTNSQLPLSQGMSEMKVQAPFNVYYDNSGNPGTGTQRTLVYKAQIGDIIKGQFGYIRNGNLITISNPSFAPAGSITTWIGYTPIINGKIYIFQMQSWEYPIYINRNIVPRRFDGSSFQGFDLYAPPGF